MGMSPFQRKCAATLPVIVLAALSLACADEAVDAALDATNADGGGSDANRTGGDAGTDADASGKTRADAGVDGAALDAGSDASAVLAAHVVDDAGPDARDAGARADDASLDGSAEDAGSADALAPNTPIPLMRRGRY